MTATMTTVPTTSSNSNTNTSAVDHERSSSKPGLWRTGAVVGVTAAAATTVVAAGASAMGVSLEASAGEEIPLLGVAQLTLFFTAVGVLLARVLGRRAHQPRATFTKTAVVLTALSLVPDVTLSTDVATKVTLMLTHVVAAAIVIPALSARLAERNAR